MVSNVQYDDTRLQRLFYNPAVNISVFNIGAVVNLLKNERQEGPVLHVNRKLGLNIIYKLRYVF